MASWTNLEHDYNLEISTISSTKCPLITQISISYQQKFSNFSFLLVFPISFFSVNDSRKIRKSGKCKKICGKLAIKSHDSIYTKFSNKIVICVICGYFGEHVGEMSRLSISRLPQEAIPIERLELY